MVNWIVRNRSAWTVCQQMTDVKFNRWWSIAMVGTA